MHTRGVRTAALALALAAGTALPAGRPAAQSLARLAGHVEIGVPVATRRPAGAYPSRAVGAPVLAHASEIRHVVVYLNDAPARPVTPIRATIEQRHETFIPRVAAVPVGSDVAFPNDDPLYHNVFSLSRARSFNLGRYPRGASPTVRFTKPGIVKVFCDIHSHMTASVIVFDHPWFAVPDAAGRFDLPDVPPGDWTVTAWHERLGDTTLRVHAQPGATTTVDFVLPVPAS